jgi:hypothetical protein
MVGGSDFPIESHNPLTGINAFVRRIPNGQVKSWFPDEILSVGLALEAYCFSPHIANGNSHRRGILQPGYDADFVIIDKPINSIDSEEILNTKVVAAYCNGEKIFG